MEEKSGYLSTFWALAEDQENKRIKAAKELVDTLVIKQGKVGNFRINFRLSDNRLNCRSIDHITDIFAEMHCGFVKVHH